MNPFKVIGGRRGKRKPNSVEVEVKQEPVIKEEPTNDDYMVIDVRQPETDGRFRMNWEGPFDFDDDINAVKDEIKSEEEEETCKEKDLTSSGRSGGSGENVDDNEELIGGAVGVHPLKPVGSDKKRDGSSKGKNKQTIRRNQAAKNQKKHKCHVCNHLARDKYTLKVHLRRHTGEKPFKCDVCSKSFAHKHHLNNHKKIHGNFRCAKCKGGFAQESVKIYHERICNPRRFECDVCGCKAMGKSQLLVHMRIHTGDKPFECPICYKLFTQNANLQRHSITHKNELPNACSKCGRRFAILKDKQAHEMRCHRTLYACYRCAYKTEHSHVLKLHMQSKHGAKRSIDCEICCKKFFQQIQLNQHLSTAHNEQFPFKCSKCFRGYTTEDEKNAHEANCGYRQYQCHLCKKYRRDKRELKSHMRKDHTGERIKCKVCAANFINKSNANQHMKTVHRSQKK